MPQEFVNKSHNSSHEDCDLDEKHLDSIELEANYYNLAVYAFFVTEEELEHDAQTKIDQRVYANRVMSYNNKGESEANVNETKVHHDEPADKMTGNDQAEEQVTPPSESSQDEDDFSSYDAMQEKNLLHEEAAIERDLWEIAVYMWRQRNAEIFFKACMIFAF